MRSFRCNSIEEGIAINKELNRIDRKKEREEDLRKIKHGHDFGYDQKCDCGLILRDYYIYQQENPLTLCPKYNQVRN